jgi:hypothetical protein
VAITQHLHLQEALSLNKGITPPSPMSAPAQAQAPAHAQAHVCSPSLAAPGSSNIWASCSGAVYACIPMQPQSQSNSLPPNQCILTVARLGVSQQLSRLSRFANPHPLPPTDVMFGCFDNAPMPILAADDMICPLSTPSQLHRLRYTRVPADS